MYQEMREDEEKKKEEKGEKKVEKKESSMYGRDGKLRQCNEGKYEFKIDEWDDPEWSYFELDIPKYMSTDLLDVNLFPNCVSIRIKGKLTQVKLWEEIIVSESKIQRSKTTGKLHITLKKFIADKDLYKLREIENRKKEKEEKEKLEIPKHFGTLHLGDKSKKKEGNLKPMPITDTPFFGKVEEISEATLTEKERIEKEKQIKKMIEDDEELDDLPDLE